jgi:hypothetical protein
VLFACVQYDDQRTATTPATAITAAARLPTPWLEAPPVDLATEDPVAEGDPAEPPEPAADAVPDAMKVDVIPEPVTAAVVVMTEVLVQEQEESYDSVV